MTKVSCALIALLTLTLGAQAASVTNKDAETRVIVVTEGGSRGDLTLSPGDTVEFCPDGCFVTMPNGDREALTGGETMEIVNGRAVFK